MSAARWRPLSELSVPPQYRELIARGALVAVSYSGGKGERRFIATIARRLDSLGAITRGQRDSQTAMGGDATLFRESDNLESLYAKAALRQFYMALWRGAIDGWSLADFEEATGLKLVHEGTLKEELPPMSRSPTRRRASTATCSTSFAIA